MKRNATLDSIVILAPNILLFASGRDFFVKILKNISILIVLNLFFFAPLVCKAQRDLYTPPDEKLREEYLGAGRKFSVGFAGPVSTQTWNIWVGPAERYSSELKGAKEIVRVQRFRNLAVLDGTLEELLKPFYKDVLGYVPRVEFEKKITRHGLSGLELGVFGKGNYARIRMFKTFDRVYFIVSEVANWDTLTSQYPERARAFVKRSMTFLESFKVLAETTKEGSASNKSSPASDTYSFKDYMFESPAGGFRAYFPKRPMRKIFPAQPRYDSTDMISHSRSTRGAIYSVSYFDTPNLVTNNANRNILFAKQKESIIALSNLKFLSESPFVERGYTGKEFIFTGKNSTTRLRVFLVQQRLFRLGFVSKGLMGRLGKSKDKKFRKAADKFFRSFEVTVLPPFKRKKSKRADGVASLLRKNAAPETTSRIN